MQRDMDLIRQILLRVEATNDRREEPNLVFDNYRSHQVAYHVWLLVDAGFLKGDVQYYQSDYVDFLVHSLTWKGHEFLDSIRDENIWSKTKGAAKTIGSFSVELLFDLAKGFLKQKAKELTGLDIG